MSNNLRFYRRFQRLKSMSEDLGLYEEVTEGCLTLLEQIKKRYGDDKDLNPLYDDTIDLCRSVLTRVNKFVITDDYEKRLRRLEENEPKKEIKANLLTCLKIEVLKEVLLVDLRGEFKKSPYLIKKQDLTKIYGSKIENLEGLVDILEGICFSGIDIHTDPVFIKINWMYNHRIEKLELSKKPRYEEIEKRYDELMERIDFVAIAKARFNRKKRINKDVENTDCEPSDRQLIELERRMGDYLKMFVEDNV